MRARAAARGAGRGAAVALTVAMILGGAAPGLAKHPAIARAESAIQRGAVDPGRDIAPLLAALASARSVEEKRELVGAIADLGAADGEAPNAVKSFLVERAPPLLLEVARTGADAFLQGDAITALRGMDVPRSVLEQAATIAEADPDPFVKSRGEILRNFIRALPVEDAAAARRATDPERQKAGIAYLDRRGLAVSTDALRDAARRADADAVRALLDAGVAPDTGVADLNQTPLYFAVAQGCHAQGAETDWLVETVRLLVAAGADLARIDDNGNTVLVSAAQYCGARVIGALVEGGARIDVRNRSGITPLTLALIVSNFDAAEALVAKGARLAASDQPMVAGVTDPRGRAIVQRASGRGGKT